MLFEGLVSATWQAWGLFCREVIIASAVGCKTRAGVTVASCVTPVAWERASYVAIRAAAGNQIVAGQINSILRREPAWGDVDKLIAITNQLKPDNRIQLLAAFGAGLRGPLHMQKIRNSAAHWNNQTVSDVLSLGPYYISGPIRHPIEAIFWIQPSSNDYAFCSWIEDLRLLADIATE